MPNPGGTPTPDRLDAELAGYGATLVRAVQSLLARPHAELRESVASLRSVVNALGPRAVGDTSWLERRESYLVDAGERLADGATRLAVALAAPQESDVSTRVVALRDAVGYLGDVAAELVPANAVRAVATALPPAGRDLTAPGLYLQVLPVVELALDRMRTTCVLAVETAESAERILAAGVPGFAGAVAARRDIAIERHREVIDGLLSALEARRPVLSARPRESAETYDRALDEWFGLTPAQLGAILRRYAPPTGTSPRRT